MDHLQQRMSEKLIAPAAPPHPWFALTLKHQHERAVAAHLASRGLETFLPLYRSRRIWTDRVKELEVPLFPGYIFCRFLFEERVPILNTPGVRSIVTFNRQATPVDPAEVEAIRMLVSSGRPLTPCDFLKVGQRIRIDKGPLTGLEGILQRFRDTWRIVVGVTLLQRSVSAEIDSSWVTPL